MATYNGENHIYEQLNTILNQKFIKNLDVELEIIISDDNSSDQTLNIIKNFNDSRIKIIKHTQKKYKNYNSLISATKNFENAINHSTGEYIFLSDQDDIWYSNKIDMMLGALQKKTFCICSFDWIDQSGQNIGSNIHDTKTQSLLKLISRFPYYGFCFGFRKDFKNYILPIPTVPQHDIYIGLIAALKKEIIVLPDVLCAHRKFINTTLTNVSDSSFKVHFTLKLFYRIKVIFFACIRSL